MFEQWKVFLDVLFWVTENISTPSFVNSHQFELRMYNQDIGRWFAPDPYGQFSSPYIGMANNPVSAVDPDGGWVNMGGATGSNTNSREWRKANFVGEFSLEEMQKRYDKAYKEIIDYFVNGDVLGYDRRNTERMFETILGLNNDYAGLLGNSGYALAMQNGTEYLTHHESWLAYESGRMDEMRNSSGQGFKMSMNEGGYDWQKEVGAWANDKRSIVNTHMSENRVTAATRDGLAALSVMNALTDDIVASNEATQDLLSSDTEESKIKLGLLGDPGNVNYDGKALFGTNFVGPSKSNEDPYSIPDPNNPDEFLQPKDQMDEAAQVHDAAYVEYGTGGVKGALKDTRLFQADVNLVNAAREVIDGYKNGAIDRVTGYPISQKTYNIARIVNSTFTPIIFYKFIKD